MAQAATEAAIVEDGADGDSLPPGSSSATFSGKLNLEAYGFRSRRVTRSSSSALSPVSMSPIRKMSPKSVVSQKQRASKSTSISTSTSTSKSKSKSTTSSAPNTATTTNNTHLPLLADVLAPSLITLFIGLNPGILTSTSGHAYAHPSNHFWKLLHRGGLTSRQCDPTEDGTLPALYALGNTNIVARPSRSGADLKRGEMDAGVQVLEEKIRRWRPESVCLVGKGIWESVERVKFGKKGAVSGNGKGKAKGKNSFEYGWQEGVRMGVVRGGGDEEGWEGARVFVATSTSGLAASVSWDEKLRIWSELGSWVQERRKERALAAGGGADAESSAAAATAGA